MCALALIIFAAGWCWALFYLRGRMALGLRLAEEKVVSLKKTAAELKVRQDALDETRSILQEMLTRTVKMYEAARDICATLDGEDVVNRFKTDLKKLMMFEDCRLLPAESPEVPLVSAPDAVFPLSDKDTGYGYLLIKGGDAAVSPYLGILLRHFSLGLKRARLYKAIQELAITDGLTGLYTRRYALERLSEECARSLAHATPLSFLMIDVDNFKDCNDKYGHLVGDIVLVEIARRIKENIREVDTLARFGGEEFMVLAPNTTKENALVVAERIREGVGASEIRAFDEKLKVTVSIGMAGCPSDADKTDDLVGKADWALYQAKKTGKNRVAVFGQFHE